MAKNKVELAIIDGDGLMKHFFWLEEKKSGDLYCGSFQEDFGVHISVHKDGSVWASIPCGRSRKLPSKLFLGKLKGIRCLLSGALRIAPEVLGELGIGKGRTSIVSVDLIGLANGCLGFEVYLVEPNRLDLLDTLKPVRKPVEAQTITSFVPWLYICLYDGVHQGENLGVEPEEMVGLVYRFHHDPEEVYHEPYA